MTHKNPHTYKINKYAIKNKMENDRGKYLMLTIVLHTHVHRHAYLHIGTHMYKHTHTHTLTFHALLAFDCPEYLVNHMLV